MPVNIKNFLFLLTLLFFFSFTTLVGQNIRDSDYPSIVFFVADPGKEHIHLFWKNDKEQLIGSLGNLKKQIESKGKVLAFAMNGGMYKKDHSPQGLYIENGKTKSPVDTHSWGGNFYLKPNGIFYLTDKNKAVVCETGKFPKDKNIVYATQSGPMLLIEGKYHPAFNEGSANLNIRNGVGVLPDGKIVFVMSKGLINFYDFATFFKKIGCRNALYLDGFVSQMYCPSKKWEQLEGDFGVMIGVIK